MSSTLGLDLSKNISYFTIPILFVATCLAPHNYAIAKAGKVYDNTNPRFFLETVRNTQALDSATKQSILRAQFASDNSFETVGLYAAAVVAANAAGVDHGFVNNASIIYVASRVAFVLGYINFGENLNLSFARTGIYLTGIGAIFSLFVKAGLVLTH